MAEYDSEYYEGNDQSSDRPALDYYYRFFKNEMGRSKTRARVLEYGCGVGHLTKRLVSNYDCYALDISDYALSKVNERAPEAKTIKTLHTVEDESLDGIIALHVMEHIEDPLVTFREFHDKLKPGGVLVYVVPNPDGYGHKMKKDKWFAYSDKTHISLLSEAVWKQLTADSGFKITKSRGDGMWDVPYLPMLPTTIQKAIFFPPTVPQFVVGRAFLPTRLGECLIVVAKKEPLVTTKQSAKRTNTYRKKAVRAGRSKTVKI